jgi:hypothetical protein
MLQRIGRIGRRMTCPPPEALVPHASGTPDPTITRHVEGCSACQAELAQLREVIGTLRAERSLEPRNQTSECLDELVIADFVEGRLAPAARASVVAHLVTCARCRSVVAATGRLLGDETVSREMRPDEKSRWRRWSLPVGLAAAAAVLLLVWPRSAEYTDPTPSLRDSPPASSIAPVAIAPRASVSRVDRFVWSSVPRVDRYRLRLYDDEGKLMWSRGTGDTVVTLPTSVTLSGDGTYSWKVEAETESGRWTDSDVVDFQLGGSGR